MPAIIVHLSGIHSKSMFKEPTALQSLGACLKVLAGMVARFESAGLLLRRFGESLNDAGIQLNDILLIAQQQLQNTNLDSVPPACIGTVSLSDFIRDGAFSQGPSPAKRQSPSRMTEHDGVALGQSEDSAHHIDSSTNLPSAPNLVPPSMLAEPTDSYDYSYDFLTMPDDSLMPAVASSGIGLGDAISDIAEPLPPSYMLEAPNKSLTSPHFLDFSFEDFDESFSINPYTPYTPYTPLNVR
jgi:hypothetical protein